MTPDELRHRLEEAEAAIELARTHLGQLSAGCFREPWAATLGAAAWCALDNYHFQHLRAANPTTTVSPGEVTK